MTPKAHESHTKPCGCDTSSRPFIVCPCGAGYTSEVLEFTVFTCYDCGRHTTEELRLLALGKQK